ncbi:MAG: hypothetical protein WCL14_11615 [Bacteroidota bacterium]
MKNLTTIVIVFFVSLMASKGQSITPEETARHINDSVTVCGVVKEVHFIKKDDKYTVNLEFGDKFPNEVFTVFISDDVRKKISYDLHDLAEKNICVTGKIKMMRKKPQIVLRSFDQIKK